MNVNEFSIKQAFWSSLNHYTQGFLSADALIKRMGPGGDLHPSAARTMADKTLRPLRVLEMVKEQYYNKTIPSTSWGAGKRTGMATDMVFYALGRDREINGYTTTVLGYFPETDTLKAGDIIMAGDVYSETDITDTAMSIAKQDKTKAALLEPILKDIRHCLNTSLQTMFGSARVFTFTAEENEKQGRHGMSETTVALWPAKLIRYIKDGKICRPCHVPYACEVNDEYMKNVATAQVSAKYSSRNNRVTLGSVINLRVEEPKRIEDAVKPMVFHPSLENIEKWARFEFHCFDLLRQSVDDQSYLIPLSAGLTGIDRSDSGKMDALFLSSPRSSFQCAMQVDATMNSKYVEEKSAQMDNMLAANHVTLVTDSRINRNDMLLRSYDEETIAAELGRHDRELQRHLHHTYFALRNLRDGEIELNHDALVGGVVILNNMDAPVIERRGIPRRSRCGRFMVFNVVISVGAGYIGNYIRKTFRDFQDGKGASLNIDFMRHLTEWVRAEHEMDTRKAA